MAELKGEACGLITQKKYQWILPAIGTVWVIFIQQLIPLMGTGVWMFVILIIFIAGAILSLDKCAKPADVFYRILPYILPIIIGAMIILASSNTGLQLLGIESGQALDLSNTTNFMLSHFWELAAFEASIGGAGVSWYWYLILYIVGGVIYVVADAANFPDIVKGFAGIAIVAPIFIQAGIALTSGTATGFLGSWLGAEFNWGALGMFGYFMAFAIGSLVDLMIVGLFFGFENIVPEEAKVD